MSTISNKKKKHNTAPLLTLKALTSSRTSRKVSIGGPTTSARVESNDKGGHVMCSAGSGRWNGSGGANDDWSGACSDGQRCVVVKRVGNSYDGRSVSPVLSRDGLYLNGASIGGYGNRNRVGHLSSSLNKKGLKSTNSGGGNEFRKDVVLVFA